MGLLEELEGPHELSALTFEQLSSLASEVRDKIIHVMSQSGGHLASNLGTVELIIALHYVFDNPEDPFIFDVSHQTYTHKLLTGRNSRFFSIRQHKGLCGFAHPKESAHDLFYAGHAGTALSLALGVAKERDFSKKKNYVIPIIGDASLTCGLTLEALNNIPPNLKRFIVLLNDNEMSISKNVGGITNILSRIFTHPRALLGQKKLKTFFSRAPLIGPPLAKMGEKISHSLLHLVSPAPFFEQFGLSYIGPIDGHDIKKMVEVFEAAKKTPLPLLIHLYTQKGYGLKPAENDPIAYHGVKSFDPKTCEFIPQARSKPTFPKIFGKHLLKMGADDSSLHVITPAMSLGSCLDPFAEKYSERCFDVGIAEGHAVTFAGGLAKGGACKVICSIYGTFLQRALDNLFHDVCLQEIPVVFAIDRGGISAADGATHHGIYDVSFLKAMPNMVICQPRDGKVLKELCSSAFSWQKPTAIRYPNLETEEPEGELVMRHLGQGELLVDGEDLLLLPLGHMASTAFALRDLLKAHHIEAAIFDPIFIKPLDGDSLGSLLLKHQRIVTIEELSIKGGLGIEINNFLLTHSFHHVQVLNFGLPDTFIHHGNYKQLLEENGLAAEKMVQPILNHFSFKGAKLTR